MARNRKRAKDRKRRRGVTHHENVSGSLEHTSGEVEEFDAALIKGADGETAGTGEIGGASHPEELSDKDFAELEDSIDQLEEDMESGDRDKVAEDEAALEEKSYPTKPAAKGGLLARAVAFLKSSWSELQRVQWPDRRQVGQATAVVLGFVVIAGVYLGIADVGAQKLVNLII